MEIFFNSIISFVRYMGILAKNTLKQTTHIHTHTHNTQSQIQSPQNKKLNNNKINK